MYKRTVEFEDYDGNNRKEDFYFHLNKAEVIQWLTCNGGYTLDKMLKKLYDEGRGRDIMDTFEDLMRRAYGVKSVDGRRFDKSKEIWENFRNTEAFSVIFTDLVTNAKAAGAFINSIIPSNMAKEINSIMEDNIDGVPEELRDYMTSDVLDENGNTKPLDSTGNVTPIRKS